MGAFLDFRLKWQYEGKTGEIKAGQESLFHRAFVGLREGMVDWTPTFGEIAEDILTPLLEETYEKEKPAEYIAWADLAESTIARRGSAHPILDVTGLLRRSFTKGGAQHHEEITPKKLVWGSDIPYAVFLQTGTQKGYQKATGVPTGPGTGCGMAMRKLLHIAEFGKETKAARQITQAFRGRIDMVARQYGFKTFGRGVDAGEARRIGYIALGLRR